MSTRTATRQRTMPLRAPRRSPRSGPWIVALLLVGAIATAAVVVLVADRDEPPAPSPALPEAIAVPTREVRITPETLGAVTVWRLPGGTTQPKDVAPDGSGVWVSESANGAVGRLDSDGRYVRYQVDRVFPDAGSFMIALADDLWFTGYPGSGVGRITSDSRANYFEALTEEASAAVDIAASPDGSLWVTDPLAGRLVHVDPGPDASVAQVAVSPPNGDTRPPQPYAVAVDPGGTVWFTDPSTNAVGHVPANATVAVETAYEIGSQSPRGIDIAPDGTVWVALTPGQPRLLRIDPDGSSSVVRVADGTSGLQDLAVAPDGTLWLAQPGRMLHVRPSGTTLDVVRFPPGIPFVSGIGIGPDGTVWAAAFEANAVLQIAPND